MDRSDIIASVVPGVTSQPVARPPNHECDSARRLFSKDIEAPAIFALARQSKDARQTVLRSARTQIAGWPRLPTERESMRMKARSAKGVRAGRPTQASIVEVVRSREQLQVWLRDSRRRQLTGTIGIELASDAKRLRQDLVGTLVDRALREAERNRLV